jgi:golgi-specific brefeldin A-resistance guanine nucleotide exchange factor 1
MWKPILASLSYSFKNFSSESLLQRVITGFRETSNLAAKFEMIEVFDYIISFLSEISGLKLNRLKGDAGGGVNSGEDSSSQVFPNVKVENQNLVVSPLSVKFGINFKAQLGAVVLFNVVKDNGIWIGESWSEVIRYFSIK